MLVRFVNRGYKTDDGLKEAEVVRTDLSIHGAPELIIANPVSYTHLTLPTK